MPQREERPLIRAESIGKSFGGDTVTAVFEDVWFDVKRGERIAQLVPAPVLRADFHEIESLDETERGDGGFGSTGR